MRRSWVKRRRVRFAVEALEARALLTGGSPITEVPTPTAGSAPEAVTVGANGNLYFAEYNKGAIGEFNTSTGAITETSITTPNAKPFGIAAGPGGVLYFTEPTLNAIGIYNPATGAFTSIATPTSGSQPEFITQGSDGNMYFTELLGDKIGVLNTSTNAITEIGGLTAGAQPYGITSGPGGTIYFTEENANNIGEYNLTTHAVTETAVPTATAEPSQITTGPDGNIWFTEYNVAQIGKLNVTTNAITEYSAGTGAVAPSGIVAGPDGLLYFTEFGLQTFGHPAGAIGTINPSSPSTSLTTTLTPTANSEPFSIVTASDGNVYFTELAASKIAKFTLATSLQFTTEPVATVTAGTFITATVKDVYATGVVDESYSGNVTMSLSSNPAGGVLAGTLTEAASLGTAVFPNLLVGKAGSGYVLGAAATGFTSVASTPFAVVPGAASRLVVVAQPPATMLAGSTFGVAALVEDSSGNIVANYHGDVVLAFAADPGGTTLSGSTTAVVTAGVAAFPGLSLSVPAAGYVLETAANGLGFGLTKPFTIMSPKPPPPVVIAEGPLFNQRFNKKGRPIGKPIFVGFSFTFSQAMNPNTAGAAGDYQLDAYQIRRFRGHVTRILHPLAFRVNYVASTHTAQILLNGKPPFFKGGQITLLAAPPFRIQSAAGVMLDGNDQGVAGDNGVFIIAPHGRGVSPT